MIDIGAPRMTPSGSDVCSVCGRCLGTSNVDWRSFSGPPSQEEFLSPPFVRTERAGPRVVSCSVQKVARPVLSLLWGEGAWRLSFLAARFRGPCSPLLFLGRGRRGRFAVGRALLRQSLGLLEVFARGAARLCKGRAPFVKGMRGSVC